jgi:uncharacterized protein
MRVREIGLRLAAETGANASVVELFSLFHDSQRISEGSDPDHGNRGAQFAAAMRDAGAFRLTDVEFDQLYEACSGHSDGLTTASTVTVMTCWDADRLDLGRVGIMPNSLYLCTEVARQDEMISWAFERSRAWADRRFCR